MCCSGNKGGLWIRQPAPSPAPPVAPGRTRKTANVDQARMTRYLPTAYISDEVLISVTPGRGRDDPDWSPGE